MTTAPATPAARASAHTTYYTEWETVAVTALPLGWRNVYRDGDDLEANPCPAILLQENRGTWMAWDEPDGDGPSRRRDRFEAATPPYETRAVFADWDGADLCPADDAGNYFRTICPGQDLLDPDGGG